MNNNESVSRAAYERQFVQLKKKFHLFEKRLSLKADEIVFTMAVSHRKEIDQLKEEVIHLREQIKDLKKEKKVSSKKNLHLSSRKKSAG
ncbi:hypothetical protein [Halobacillus sp. A5]|uniref:hypothetical protein n=1 Tax=Halobacillus sp. A5 TaxID=2880263 RepID=UPI0020A6B967|nr:hypothetical protein [Halobacillus sp. A5]MCP3025893.1 hypothetical protein [Halobacillus sp. A5]